MWGLTRDSTRWRTCGSTRGLVSPTKFNLVKKEYNGGPPYCYSFHTYGSEHVADLATK